MSLADSLAANKSHRKGPVCTVCTLIAGMTPEDVSSLQEAFADPAFTSAAIHRALKAEGHDVSVNTLIRHRKKECRG